MPFLKKITGSSHSHSRSGSASSIKTWSVESPSSSDKYGSRPSKGPKKPTTFDYRSSVASSGSYGSASGYTQRLPAAQNAEVGSYGSELTGSSQLCGKHVTDSTDGGSDSRKSSGGSVNSLSVNRLILSWDTTDPDEWTVQRVLSWLKFHEFPESWINFFRKQQLSGHNFIKLLAYENFAVYEKYLPQSSNASYSSFQQLLKQTMSKNVTDNHIRQRSLGKSKDSTSSNESLRARPKKVHTQEELLSSRSTSESALLSTKSQSLSEDEKTMSSVPLRSHQKTTSTSALYRRSLISLRGSTSGNLLEGKTPSSIKLSIPSRPHSIVDTSEPSAKSGSPPSSPYYSGIFRRHQKSSSSESSLLNTLFGSASNSNLSDDFEKLNNLKSDVTIDNLSKSKPNLNEPNSSISSKQSSGIAEEKSSLWGKLRRRSQLVGLNNFPQTPQMQVTQPKATSLGNTEVEWAATSSDASVGTLTPGNADLIAQGASLGTPRNNHTRKLDEGNNYSPNSFLLDKKFYPWRNKSAQNDNYILITKDNKSFIPMNIDMIQTLEQLKESIILMLGINHSEITLHLTDFGCEIGSALPDDILERLRSSLFLNTAGKLFIKDQAKGRSRVRPATLDRELNQSLRQSQSRASFRSVSNNMLGSNDEVSIVSSSSDITSFDDLASGPVRRYPQTPNHYCETVPNNSGEEPNYWNCKDTFPEIAKSPRPLRSSSTIQKDRSIGPDLPMEKARVGTFEILRKDDGNEIDFNKRRESPYIQPKLAPRREAPKPPTNSSPQRSTSPSNQLQIPRVRRSSTNRQATNNTKLSVKTNLITSNDAVSPSADSVVNSYTPGSSHVLVPQPYRGANEGSRKSKSDQDQILNPVSTFISKQRSNRSNSNASNTSSIFTIRSQPLKKGNSKRIISSASAADVFEENDITFIDAPELSDTEDDNSVSSDEIIWSNHGTNKPEDKNIQKLQKTSGIETSDAESMIPSLAGGEADEKNGVDRKMTLRPSPEVVYQNLEKFFPHANLDKPVLEGVTPPVSPKSMDNKAMCKAYESEESRMEDAAVTSSPTRRSPQAPCAEDRGNRKDRLPKRAKTIRTIAHEASEARKQSMKVRRQNTKLWGTRTVEVTDKRMVSINKTKNSQGQYKEFAWIKGEMIGKGSFGAVYLCLNVTTGEMMAVKQVEVPRYGSQNEAMLHTVEALRAEVSTLKNLDHLNIVQYLGFEVKDNINSLFLEYVAGGSVGSLIRMYGRFDEPMIKHLTTQVLSGLSYLHSRGILHRDMKADNLLLDQEGICKISDFGISRKSQDIYSNSEMTMRGTVFWMAPEMVDTAQGYSAKVDIWSVGCVVLEMLAGKRPWSNLEVVAAMFKIGKSKSAPPIPEDTLPLISQFGRDFLDACFEVDPEARPTADQLLRHPFLHLDQPFDFKSTKLAKLIRSNDRVNSTKLRAGSQDKCQLQV
ncbi:hypothetical protein HG536_0F01540 [Torulaspora globosa]|uniref:mitogen-activated protein kinase kinase kinase n=1 Tax=Torulaspora globosa TaxID=48254 RepID=A0A7G3ZJZ3_9SACH|nr:uncharacterized protein HG536_0F01540 [Torulaspora globosa]QLL33829.1 hypothetical protein HG536_0F01540 [Torulaspora globosa]